MEHLARHQLEQLLAGDPRSRVHPALRVHLASCDQCSTRKRALDAARAHFLAEHDGADFARSVIEHAAQVEPTPRRRFTGRSSARLLALLVLFALGGAAMVWFARAPADAPGATASDPAAPAQAPPAASHAQEPITFQVLVKRDGKPRAVQDGDELAPGDRLTFEYAIDRSQHLLLLGIDDSGMVTRYFPGDPTLAAARPATVHAELPVVVELDPRKGEERIYAFFYDAIIDETAVRRAMVQALSDAHERGGISAMREIDAAARQVTLWYRKP